MIALLRPTAVMPVHGEFRMLAAHAQLARERGVPDGEHRHRRERQRRRAHATAAHRSSTASTAGMTFVDGLGVGDVHDVALRDRRRLSEDGVLIVVATLAGSNGRRARRRRPELIARGFGDGGEPLLDELREEAERVLRRAARRRRHRDQAPAGAPARRARAARLRPDAPAADDPARARRGVSDRRASRAELGRRARGATRARAGRRRAAARRRSCGACEVVGARVLPAARALGARRARSRRRPGERQAALRRAADRVETALAGLEGPLDRYLLELEAEALEGRSWYGGPGAAELLDWEPVLDARRRARAAGARRAGVPRARRARARARGAHRRGADRRDARPLVALGRALRPAREPARPRGRGPPRAREP